MSILIKGMEMPTDGNGICIDWHGNVSMIGNKIKDVPTAHAVELPQHGDLIDREAALYALCEAVHKTDAEIPCRNQIVSCTWKETRTQEYAEKILALPTIIEAEEADHEQ